MPPWFDEVVFADMSRSVANANKFLINVNALSTNNSQIFFFGPVFFYVQAAIIKMCGLSAFSFRLPVYISGVVASFVFAKTIFFITGSKIYHRAFLALFFTNFLICGSLSCGRMEMVALLFVAISVYFLLKAYFKKKSPLFFINMIVSAAFFAVAVLTTPRSAFLYLLCILPLFEMFLEGIRNRSFITISAVIFHGIVSFALPYLIWYKPHLGNVFQIFAYIRPSAETQFSISNARLDVNSFGWVLIDLFLLALILVKKVKLPSYVYAWFVASCIFIKVVIPWSYHHGLITPFLITIALLSAFYMRRQASSKLLPVLFTMIFCIQALFIITKYVIVWTDLPSRNGEALANQVRQQIPPGSKVMGNYNYYYACMKDECEFRSIEDVTDVATGKPITMQKKIAYLMNGYAGQYIIARDDENFTVQSFLNTGQFKKIGTIRIPADSKTFWQTCRQKFGLPNASFYDGFIFMRIRD